MLNILTMRTSEQISKIKATIADPFSVENFLSADVQCITRKTTQKYGPGYCGS